ncbi:hypothetical protein PMI30_05163 [Pseudomonas sp. GM50]|uniref:hypothetical protein n=1 Tax=Pseudomonas sp. GM50 TaxID=1144332 RepID=UPI00027090FF|nr:hypothetical protein [Pseudomonas sp. GM50]EJM61573.1 hypothetical protein PMI30_05163 [Pseudomonas sp. GM50]
MRKENAETVQLSTDQPADMAHFHEVMSVNADLAQSRLMYRHAAELISNVYHHAPHPKRPKVNWSFDCFTCKHAVIVRIQDDGLGFFESLQLKGGTETTADLALANLTASRLNRFNRGQGIADVVGDFKSGELLALSIESPAGSVFLGETSTLAADVDLQCGTRITFAVARMDGKP